MSKEAIEEAKIDLFEESDGFEIDQEWDVKEEGNEVTQQWEDNDVNGDFSLQLRRELTSITEKKPTVVTNTNINYTMFKQCKPKVIYFSDLTDEQLTALFRECPLLRFQLCSVIVSYENFGGKNPKLFGTIQANDTRRSFRGLSSDPATLFTFSHLFNRKFYDPILLPDDHTTGSICLNHDISFCSIPTSLSVQIVAQLYVTTDFDDMDSNDDFEDNDDDDYDDDDDDDQVKRDDKFDRLFRASSHYDLNWVGDWGLKSKCDADKDDDDEVDKENVTNEEGGDVTNQLFEVCYRYSVIDFVDSFANTPYGGAAFATIKGEGGSLQLNYVALKYAVDASLEVEFYVATTSKETNIVGSIVASYGNDFDYGLRPKRKHLYNATLFETKDDVFVKHGRINLMRSELAVPSPFSLIIDANLRDLTSGLEVLSGCDEFHVPCDGSDSIGSIKGVACSLKLKVHWKLPFDMLSL